MTGLCHEFLMSVVRVARRGQLIGIAVVVGWGLSGLGVAQESGRAPGAISGGIQGVVQQQGKGIANHRIMLIRFGPSQSDVNRTPGQTDEQGRFAFGDLETGSDYTYFVGIRYQNQLHRSVPVSLEGGQSRDDIVLDVGGAPPSSAETAPGPTELHIAQQIIAVTKRGELLEVREIVSLLNPGPKPYTGNGELSGAVLYLPLPQGHFNVRDIQGWAEGERRTNALGIYKTTPLAPGNHRVVYTYSLPFDEKVTTILARRTLPTRVFDIFVAAEALVATSDIPFGGRLPIEAHEFLHFRGTELTPGSRNWIQVTRIDESGGTFLRRGAYGLVLGVALMGVVIPLYGLWRGERSAPSETAAEPEELDHWRGERDRLIHAIAQLDDAYYEGGAQAPVVYRQRRQAYKRELLEAAEQLRIHAGYDETSLVTQKDAR